MKFSQISGFPEFLPPEQMLLNRILGVIRGKAELYGFLPIETAAVERIDTLVAKGGNENEIYALRRLAADTPDEGAKDIALHFDLTVPMARYVAQNAGQLAFPFKRYQMQKVWRGERPQEGRYREFYQCDMDIIGDETLSLKSDAEVASLVHEIFVELEFGEFRIKLNNKKVLEGFLESQGIAADLLLDATRLIDKIHKIGADKFKTAFTTEIGVSQTVAETTVAFMLGDEAGDAVFEKLATLPSNETLATGIEELMTVYQTCMRLGIPENRLKLDMSLARGLTYYTGSIFEVVLTDHEGIGSVCGGGRYDNLVAAFSKKKRPGVGLSIGVTRLLPRLIKAGVLKAEKKTPSEVLVTVMDQDQIEHCLNAARALRKAGIATEVFFEEKKLGAQLKYADRMGIPFAVVIGANEAEAGVAKLKHMPTGNEVECRLQDIAATVANIQAG